MQEKNHPTKKKKREGRGEKRKKGKRRKKEKKPPQKKENVQVLGDAGRSNTGRNVGTERYVRRFAGKQTHSR